MHLVDSGTSSKKNLKNWIFYSDTSFMLLELEEGRKKFVAHSLHDGDIIQSEQFSNFVM